jgi:hypothetical protein
MIRGGGANLLYARIDDICIERSVNIKEKMGWKEIRSGFILDFYQFVHSCTTI